LQKGDLPRSFGQWQGFCILLLPSAHEIGGEINGLEKKPAFGNRIFCPTMTFLLVVLAGCAEVQVRTLPPRRRRPKFESLSRRLRPGKPGRWKMPEEEFAKKVPKLVQNVLRQTGIYEVASFEDSKSVLVGSPPYEVGLGEK
jgi:hypothetical protein